MTKLFLSGRDFFRRIAREVRISEGTDVNTIDRVSNPILSYLDDIRTRLLRIMIAFAFFSAIVTYFLGTLIDYMAASYIEMLGLNNTEVLLVTYIRLHVTISLVLGLPYFVFEIYLFLLPGLQSRERMAMLIGIPL